MLILIVVGVIVAAVLLCIGYLVGTRDELLGDLDTAESLRRAYEHGYCRGYDRGLEDASPSVVKGLPS